MEEPSFLVQLFLGSPTHEFFMSIGHVLTIGTLSVMAWELLDGRERLWLPVKRGITGDKSVPTRKRKALPRSAERVM